jgi:hypothetical protein
MKIPGVVAVGGDASVGERGGERVKVVRRR